MGDVEGGWWVDRLRGLEGGGGSGAGSTNSGGRRRHSDPLHWMGSSRSGIRSLPRLSGRIFSWEIIASALIKYVCVYFMRHRRRGWEDAY